MTTLRQLFTLMILLVGIHVPVMGQIVTDGRTSKQIADSIAKLSGTTPELLKDLPEGWIFFGRPSLNSDFSLKDLDYLFARLWQGYGAAFDKLQVYKDFNKYSIYGESSDYEKLLEEFVGRTRLEHGTWKELADKAALTKDLKKRTKRAEFGFSAAEKTYSTDELMVKALKEKLAWLPESYAGAWEKVSDSRYSFSDKMEFTGKSGKLSVTSIVIADAAAAGVTEAVSSAAEGKELLRKFIDALPIPEVPEYYILPDSDKKVLTEADLAGLSAEDLRKARNEIYARHGRRFKSADLQEYFDEQIWYEGTIGADEFDNNLLSPTETQNAKIIEDYENKVRSGSVTPETTTVPAAESAGSYVYDLPSYTFTLPEEYRGKVDVSVGGEKLSLTYKGYYVVGINVYTPADEYQGGDPQNGNMSVGTASNGNLVTVAYNSALPLVLSGSAATAYPSISDADLTDLLYLQTGKIYNLSWISGMNLMTAYQDSYYCVDLVKNNVTLK